MLFCNYNKCDDSFNSDKRTNQNAVNITPKSIYKFKNITSTQCMYHIQSYNYIFDILNYTLNQLCEKRDIHCPPNIFVPIDEKIQTCYKNIRKLICDQNNALLVSFDSKDV